MTTDNTRRWGLLAAGAGLIALAAVPAAAQECAQLAAQAEQEVPAAEMTDTQRDYVLDLIGYARAFADRGDQQACMNNLADLAEYVDQERIDLPVAAEIEEGRASAVGDTQEAGSGAQGDRPQQQQQGTAAPSGPVAAGQQAQPGVTIERAEPEITIEQAEPNVTIEQAEPRVTIERAPATGTGTGG